MDWKRVKAEYIAGGTSYRKLAEKYGVSQSTLRKVAAKEQWTELRNKARTKADSKIVEAISDVEAQKSVDIVSVADKLLKKIEDIIDQVDFPTGIKDISTALKNIKEIKGVKSDADMREQEARIRNLEKQAEADENIDTTVTVRFEEDISKWSK